MSVTDAPSAEALDTDAPSAEALDTDAPSAEASDTDAPDVGSRIEPRMKILYRDTLRAQLQTQLGFPNIMQVPRLNKISVNVGVGAALTNRAMLDGAVDDLSRICGQRPSITRAKRSIAGFKLREGNAIGARVTLRQDRMWEFYDRLVTLAIPRIRDFRGLSPRSFDGHGNYTFGITEQLVFPEIDYDSVNQIRGMDITLVTSATDDEGGRALLTALGFPFRQGQN